MHNHKHCPDCDSRATTVVHTEWYTDSVERVRICQDCPMQYTVSYGMPEITETKQVQ